MPPFEEHDRAAKKWGAVGSGLGGLLAFVVAGSAAVALGVMVAAYVGARVGGVSPDLDAKHSIPRRRMNRLLQLGVGIAAVGGLAVHRGRLAAASAAVADAVPAVVPPEALVLGAFLAATGGVIAHIPTLVQAASPPHRGPLHNPVLWLGVSALVAAGLWVGLTAVHAGAEVAGWIAGAAGASLFVSSLVHLAEDGELRAVGFSRRWLW